MPTSEIVIAETATAANEMGVSSAGSNAAPPISPFAIPADQVYYWTRIWQTGEAESKADLASGDTVVFGSASGAIHWLFSSEE